MMRKAGAWLVLVGLSGCMSVDSGSGGTGHCPGNFGHGQAPPRIPGVQGPWGQPVAVAAPYNSAPPMNAHQAHAMMSRSVPLDMVQMNRGAPGMGALPGGSMMPPTMIPAGGVLSPPGVPFAPGVPAGNSPGANAAMNVIQASHSTPAGPQAGIAQVSHQGPGRPGMQYPAQRTQIRFVRPSGMKVSWFTQGPDGKPSLSTTPIEVPGRYNFLQAAIYRLKLSNIEGRPGLEVYPTLEVVPANPKTEAFLAHSSVPIEFTNEDFKQIAEGNYVVKVIYLPDPQFQDVAGTGTDEILSTRLEPGADPIIEALRRGSILCVIRMGNMDQEAPNTPAINAPPAHAFMPPPGAVGMPGPPQAGMPGLPPGAMPGMPRGPMPQMAPPATNFVPPGAVSVPPQAISPPPPAASKIPAAPIPTAPAPQKAPATIPVDEAQKVPPLSKSSTAAPKTAATTPANLPAPEAIQPPSPVAPTGLSIPDVPMLPPDLPAIAPPTPARK